MKILFICTHNRCRSVLSEGITNHISNGRITAKSAGSSPVGEVHPVTIQKLSALGIDTSEMRSQSWDEFEAWQPDVVITVCDSAAGEACPVWFGNCIKVHWGLEDPSKIEDTEAQSIAFDKTIKLIEAKIQRLLSSDFESFSPEALRELLENIGQ